MRVAAPREWRLRFLNEQARASCHATRHREGVKPWSVGRRANASPERGHRINIRHGAKSARAESRFTATRDERRTGSPREHQDPRRSFHRRCHRVPGPARRAPAPRRERGEQVPRHLATSASVGVASTTIFLEHLGHVRASKSRVRFMRSVHAPYLARAKSSPSATASDSRAGAPTPREVRQPRRPCYVLAAEGEKKICS